MLQHFVQNTSQEALQEKLNTMAAAMGDEAFIKLVAREIVERTQPQQAIPEVYGHYRSVVRDGIEFFLSQVSRHRLMEFVISQLKLDPAFAGILTKNWSFWKKRRHILKKTEIAIHSRISDSWTYFRKCVRCW